MNLSNFNEDSWLSSLDNFQFGPHLFGDYREPKEQILSTGGFDDSFFNDAFDMDFTTPYNMPTSSPAPLKKSLIAQIDAAKEGDDEAVGDNSQLLTCNKIWCV